MTPRPFDAATLQALEVDAATLCSATDLTSGDAVVQLGEPIELWTLFLQHAGGAVALANVARWTGLFHHPLLIDSQVRGYARSEPRGASAARLQEVAESPVGAAIDERRCAARRSHTNDELIATRLLSVPELQALALWWPAADRIEVVTAAAAAGIRPGSLLSGADLLERLRRVGPIGGARIGTVALPTPLPKPGAPRRKRPPFPEYRVEAF